MKININIYDSIYFTFLRFARLFLKEKISDTSDTVATMLLSVMESWSIVVISITVDKTHSIESDKWLKALIFLIVSLCLGAFNFIYFNFKNRSVRIYKKIRNKSNPIINIIVLIWVLYLLWFFYKMK